MYSDIISLYNTYLKFLFNFKARLPLLTAKMSEVSFGLKKASMNDILQCYENFDAMLTQIFAIFEHQNFCKRTRLFSNVIYLLFLDLLHIYKVYYVLVTEILERFGLMNVD